MLRLNRAVLAAFLCSATAPAATCDPMQQMSPFNAGQWSTLEDSRVTMSRALVAPNSITQEVMQTTDATVVLVERPAVDERTVEETTAAANSLPSTSTALASTLPCTSTAPDEAQVGLR